MTDELDQLPIRLREERRRLGLTQAQLAELLGVSRSALNSYEGGRAVPDINFLARAIRKHVDGWYVLTGKHSAEVASDLIDWDKVEQILLGIRGWAESEGKQISLHREIGLLQLFYPALARGEVIEDTTFEDVMKRVA